MALLGKLLIDEPPLQVLPSLATLVGLNEALFLQQVHYWLQRSDHTKAGKKWTYNSYKEWQQQFPFWSLSTLRRIVYQLEEKGILVSANYNKAEFDQTKWYTIDYDVLENIISEKSEQSMCSIWTEEVPNLDKPIPETSPVEGPPVLSTSSLSEDKESLDKTSPPKIFSSGNSLRRKVPKQSEEDLEADIQALIGAYPPSLQSLFETSLNEFKTTRMTGAMSLGKIRKFLLDIQKYPEDCIREGLQRYVDMDCAGDGKNERYALGIIRGISKQNNHDGFESNPTPAKQPRKLLKDMIPVELRRNLEDIHPRDDWDYPIFVSRIKKGMASRWEYDYVFQKDHLWNGKSFLDEFSGYEEAIEHFKEAYQKKLPEIERRDAEMFKTYEELHPEEFMREDDDLKEEDVEDGEID